jgi:transposase
MEAHFDARKLNQKQQEQLRLNAVAMRFSGIKRVDVALRLGVNPDTVSRWTKAAKQGKKALLQKKRGHAGQPKLSKAQARTICRLIQDHHPEQLKLPFALWTREAIRELVFQKFDIRIAVRTMGTYLRHWGFTPQKPARQAVEQKPETVKQWLQETYPAVEARAKTEKALIFWGDEMGLRSDHQAGRSYSPKGKTPIVKVSGNRFRCNMISALSNKGELMFSVFEGSFVVDIFLRFLQRMLKQMKGRKVFLVVDGHPVHKAKLVKAWLEERKNLIELFFLPGYSPELNPDELLNQDLKATVFEKGRPKNKQDLKSKLKAKLHSIQKQPHKVKAYFQKQAVRYAAA